MTDCRTAVKDEHNLAHERTLPGLLSEALGIRIDEYESLRLGINDKKEITYGLKIVDFPGNGFTAEKYADWIVPTKAQRIAEYDQHHLRDFAAITRNKYDQGIGWYVGTIVRGQLFYDALIARLLADAKIKPLINPPRGVEVAIRQGDNRRLLFVINHTDKEQRVKVPIGERELLTETETTESLVLEGFGVAVIEL